MEGLKAGAALGASYRLVEPVGRGASGEVWRLESATGGDVVAKFLSSALAADPVVVERFVRERSVLLGLDHPQIVAVRDMVVEGEKLALVMDFCEGGSLREELARVGTFAPSVACAVVAVVLRALVYAHGRGVLHRDVKPDNVLLSGDGSVADRVLVSDFGVAGFLDGAGGSSTGVVGTPLYLAPELVEFGRSGPEGDVYSAGVMLYELLCGRTPFAGEGTDFSVAYRHVTSQPPRLDVPVELWNLLEGMLAKNPAERVSAVDAAAALEGLARSLEGVAALPVAAAPADFGRVEQPRTVVRGLKAEDELGSAGFVAGDAPDLGVPAGATVVRPVKALESAGSALVDAGGSSAGDAGAGKDREKRRKVMLWAVLGCLGALLVGGGIVWAVSADSRVELSASLEGNQILPSGLSVKRNAVYKPEADSIELTVTYQAQKAPLSGDFLEVLPAVGEGVSACPNVVWSGVKAERNQSLVTGMSVDCGWGISGFVVEPNSSVEVKATVAAGVANQAELDAWLRAVAERTDGAVSSADFDSSAYPVQRLQDIEVRVPERTVSQTALPLVVLPVWPNGVDELNPLYSSESVGKPSTMLMAIAGEADGAVRFSDGCSGHLAVDAGGLRVTALSVAEGCVVNASIGNFTDLKSNSFVVTTRD